jgi:glycosyltransferase involved in cell wall biosynthesis
MTDKIIFKKYLKLWPEEETVSILIPVYNEKDVIGKLIMEWQNEVLHFLPKNSSLVIDDGASTDGTSEIIKELTQLYPNIIHNISVQRDGFGNALKRLIGSVKTHWFFVSDGDGQFSPQDFWILATSRDSADIVKGSKVTRMDPFTRRISSLFFNKIVNSIFNCSFSDINAGFFLANSEILKVIDINKFKMKTLITTEFLIRSYLANFDIKQKFISHRVRSSGKSRGISTRKYLITGIRAIFILFQIKKTYRT